MDWYVIGCACVLSDTCDRIEQRNNLLLVVHGPNIVQRTYFQQKSFACDIKWHKVIYAVLFSSLTRRTRHMKGSAHPWLLLWLSNDDKYLLASHVSRADHTAAWRSNDCVCCKPQPTPEFWSDMSIFPSKKKVPKPCSRTRKEIYAELHETLSKTGRVERIIRPRRIPNANNANRVQDFRILPPRPGVPGDLKVAIVIMMRLPKRRQRNFIEPSTTLLRRRWISTDSNRYCSVEGSEVAAEVLQGWQLSAARAGRWDHERSSRFVCAVRRLDGKFWNRIRSQTRGYSR